MLADRNRSTLVVIDLQGKLVDQVERSELVVAATQRLLRMAELFGIPVVLTEQYPRGLGGTTESVAQAFAELSVPKRRVEKEAFGCCAEPTFEAALKELRPTLAPGARQVVVAGIEAHVCVLQTALALRSQGTEVLLCWEATSGRGAEHREMALRRMEQAGVGIASLESLGFEWAGDKNHPRFKDWSRILKEGQLG